MIEITKTSFERLRLSHFLLKIIYGIIVLSVGLDKFLHILSPSGENFVSPLITGFIPLSPMHILYFVGIFEIIIGLLILTKFTKLGAYLLMIWYIIIIIDLMSLQGFYTLILSNAGHVIATFVLAQLNAILHKYHKTLA